MALSARRPTRGEGYLLVVLGSVTCACSLTCAEGTALASGQFVVGYYLQGQAPAATQTAVPARLLTPPNAALATTTTLPGTEIIISGGPNATADMPGSHSDPADFYGIVLVVIVIALAIVIARWLFGRRGPGPGGARRATQR